MATAQAAKAQRDIGTITDKVYDLGEYITELKADVTTNEEQLKEANETIDELRDKIEDLNERIDELNQQVDDLTLDNQKLAAAE